MFHFLIDIKSNIIVKTINFLPYLISVCIKKVDNLVVAFLCFKLVTAFTSLFSVLMLYLLVLVILYAWACFAKMMSVWYHWLMVRLRKCLLKFVKIVNFCKWWWLFCVKLKTDWKPNFDIDCKGKETQICFAFFWWTLFFFYA